MPSSPEFSVGQENRETREMVPTIRLEFFRHDKKSASKTESGEVIPDERITLSDAGRQRAQESGRAKNPNPGAALVYGSPRDRTIETAYRQMLANEPAVTAETTLEDIKGVIRQSIPAGSKKEILTEALNFHPSVSEEFQRAADDRYEKTSDYMVFLWKDSDALAQKVGDPNADTYSRFAAGIAGIIAKYSGTYETWKRIIEKNKDKDGQLVEMQRFVGTHQSIGESFLMKVIEKTEGEAGVNEFLDMLPDRNGFGAGEGFTVQITEEGGEEKVVLTYRDKVWKVDPQVIQEIVAERQ